MLALSPHFVTDAQSFRASRLTLAIADADKEPIRGLSARPTWELTLEAPDNTAARCRKHSSSLAPSTTPTGELIPLAA